MGVEGIELLLIVAAIVSIAARKLRVPYTVGLLLAGFGLAALPIANQLQLTRELVFGTLLPPLIFEAAINIRWLALKRDLAPIILLATVGVLAASAIVAFGLNAFTGWGLGACWAFATLISATDPVSVVAIFKESGASGRLRLLVEAESLFNDGTAAVAFSLALLAVQGTGTTVFGAMGQFLVVGGGGILAGLGVGFVCTLIAGRIEDHLVELLTTTVAAYGAFLLAEHFHLSGVLATLVAGLVMGNAGIRSVFTGKGHEAVELFWDFAAFIANSIVFLLMGVRVSKVPFSSHWREILFAIAIVLVGRAVAVYGCSAIFTKGARRIDALAQHVLFWGGLRGALALALVLGLPEDFPHRESITTVAFGVVSFSLIIQGLTVLPLIKRAAAAEEGDISQPQVPSAL